ALAAADATVHVDPAGDLRPVDELLEGVGTLRLVLGPLLGAAIERFDGTQLRGVALETPRDQFRFVSLTNGQGSRRSAGACRRQAPLPSSPRTAKDARGRCVRCLRRWP